MLVPFPFPSLLSGATEHANKFNNHLKHILCQICVSNSNCLSVNSIIMHPTSLNVLEASQIQYSLNQTHYFHVNCILSMVPVSVSSFLVVPLSLSNLHSLLIYYLYPLTDQIFDQIKWLVKFFYSLKIQLEKSLPFWIFVISIK